MKLERHLSYLIYTPPKSNSHGHGARDRNLQRALTKTVDAFTDHLKAYPAEKLGVVLYYHKESEKELLQAEYTIATICRLIGEPKYTWDNADYPALPNSVTWETDDKTIFEMLEHLEKEVKERILPVSCFWIHQSYTYGNPPDGPYGTIMCSIEQGRLFVRLRLIFPYPIGDVRLSKSVHDLSKALPFKLNSKHFRRLGLMNNKYGQWKLDEELLNDLKI